jgi:hypothetical protein
LLIDLFILTLVVTKNYRLQGIQLSCKTAVAARSGATRSAGAGGRMFRRHFIEF